MRANLAIFIAPCARLGFVFGAPPTLDLCKKSFPKLPVINNKFCFVVFVCDGAGGLYRLFIVCFVSSRLFIFRRLMKGFSVVLFKSVYVLHYVNSVDQTLAH